MIKIKVNNHLKKIDKNKLIYLITIIKKKIKNYDCKNP